MNVKYGSVIFKKAFSMQKKLLFFVLLSTPIIFYSVWEESEPTKKIEKLTALAVNQAKLNSTPENIAHAKTSVASSSSADSTAEHKQKSVSTESTVFQDYIPTSLVLAAQIRRQESIDHRFNVINDRLAKEPTKSVIDVMEAIFDEEPLDLEWASENEESIYQFFRDGNSFKFLSPESVVCRSSSCKVIISVPDEIAGIEIQDKISRQLSITSSEMLSTYSATVDENLARLIIYFQKNEI